MRLFMQPVQDINIGGRLTATQYQYTLSDVDLSELNKWGPIIETALAKLPQLADVTSDQQSAAPQLTLTINRDSASRLGITPAQIDYVLYDAFGQRPIAQLYTSLNQYLRHHGGAPGIPARPERTATDLCPLADLRHGAAERAGHAAAHGGAVSVNHQGQFPSVTLSFNLKGNAPLGPAVTAIQGDAALHVPPTIRPASRATRRRSRPRFQHADPDPGGTDRGLHHPGHAVREYDPSVDHHLHAAGGRRRRAGGAAGVRLRPGCDGHHRHHPADRHREEERHHAGGFRAGSRAQPRPDRRSNRSTRRACCASGRS